MIENISELHMVGYGGLGKEVEFLLNSKFPKLRIIPYDDFSKNENVLKIEALKSIKRPVHCLIAIGDPKGRESVYNVICQNNFISFPNIILSNFENYKYSINNKIGIGNLIMPQTIIGFNCSIGDFNLFGVNSSLGHDVNIDNFNFIGPNSFLAGNVKIGNQCMLSFGTFILQKISLTSFVKTMPYTAVYKNITKQGSYHGNPAKLI
jgi:acetyltransferase-like isoleucine patch superfamily enzyme